MLLYFLSNFSKTYNSNIQLYIYLRGIILSSLHPGYCCFPAELEMKNLNYSSTKYQGPKATNSQL